MSWRHSAAVVRHDLRLLRSDPVPVAVMILMPLLIMAFLKPAWRGALVLAGVEDANGSEQAVPGMAVMFAFFVTGNVGFGVFREHAWGTWERLRASAARPVEIMGGKCVVPLLTLLLQLSVLFGIGGLVNDLNVRGSYAALAFVAAALALCLAGLGLMLLALCRTILQLNAAVNLGTILLAGLSGAMAPLDLLPGWARTIAPATPGYWAMRGFRSVIIDGGGLPEVALPLGMLLAFAAGFGLVGALRFRSEETKASFA